MKKRRSRGEGTIYYSEKSGRWIGQITLPNGKKKTKYSKSQGEIKKWLLALRQAVQDNNFVQDDSYTMSAFLNRYMTDVAQNTLSARTLISYKYLIKNHIVPEMGSIKLSQLRVDHLQALYTKKLGEGLAKRTVQYIHQFIHTTLRVAYKWGLVLRNVADLAQPPSNDRQIPTILTVPQVRDLLAAVSKDRLYPLYVCAASLGLREGEVLALHWDDIDFTRKTISINKQLQYIPGKGLLIVPPKTKSSYRILPLPDIAYDALLKHKEGATNTLVFATAKRTPFSPRNILRHFHALLTKIGLPKMAFHNLRHSCASFHLAVGTNPKVVQELLGHSTVSFTLQKYSHLLPGVQEEAAKNINKVFGQLS